MPQKISNPSGKLLPKLYCKTKNGKIQEWIVIASGDRVITRFGLEHGKVQEASKECFPTNVGRANERTAEQQAAFEAEAMWKKQVRLGYRESIAEAKEVNFGPMLAQKFDGREDKIQYPVDVQPKLDGIRCLAYVEGDDIVLMSRGNKEFNLPHLVDALECFFNGTEGLVLDGELYTQGISMQTIASWVKREGHPNQHKIQYHVYDMPSDDPWSRRRVLLKKAIGDGNKVVCRVRTKEALDAKQVWDLQHEYVAKGYEGAMVRCRDTPYEYGERSYGLLKVKKFDDAEFLITDLQEGRGKMAGCAIFRCVTDQKKEFDCVMRGTMEERRAALADKESLIGEMLIVRYFGLTDDGIPRFPVGIAIRDYE